MGRPKKEVEDTKSVMLKIRVTEKEKHDLEMAANYYGYWSVSAFIRDLVYKSMDPEEDEYIW